MSLVVAAIVTKAALAGSGCKAADKVQAAMINDGAELTVDVPALKTKTRANCDVVVTIEHPPDVALMPQSVKISWSGELVAGGKADVQFKYHFQGKAETPSGKVSVTSAGKIAAREDQIAIEQPIAGGCGEKATTVVLSIAALVRGGEVQVAKAGPFKVDWASCKP